MGFKFGYMVTQDGSAFGDCDLNNSRCSNNGQRMVFSGRMVEEKPAPELLWLSTYYICAQTFQSSFAAYN